MNKDSRRKVYFASAAVLLMLLCSMASLVQNPGSDGAATYTPLPSATSYGYIMEYDQNNMQIESVKTVDSSGNITDIYSETNMDEGSGTSLGISSHWDFDTSTGVGPFGVYYAAVNFASNTTYDVGTAIMRTPGRGD